ncbi:MAG: phosphatidylserine decarboxylase family protein [Desulfobacterales bacterium]|jgi:phosphatidylserine decarboxylase
MDKYSWSDPPGQVVLPVARAGVPMMLAGAFITAIFALLGFALPALLGLTATLCVCFFFRDPDRVIPAAPGAIVSPADGKVIVAEVLQETPFYDGPCKKVSIFMSVFNVHVNRAPIDGTVKKIAYFPGKFFSAQRDKASRDNEHNAVFLENAQGQKLCVVQIAGLIARRIICYVREDQPLLRGQRFGVICFGSRLDVYLPVETELSVAVGDKVRAGTVVLGFMKAR